jgi:hypothetical protein
VRQFKLGFVPSFRNRTHSWWVSRYAW